MFDRRKFLTTSLGAGAALGASGLVPAWALPASKGNMGIPALTGTNFDLEVSKFKTLINGRESMAVGVNGSVPAPLIRFREGDDITLNVKNTLNADTSIHWHGLLVPFHMDGVPGVTFPGIKPRETFQYKFSVPALNRKGDHISSIRTTFTTTAAKYQDYGNYIGKYNFSLYCNSSNGEAES